VSAAALYLAVFVIYPMIQAFFISLTSANLLSPTEGTFIGLANYRNALGSPELWHSIAITVLFAVVVSVAALLAGLGCALLLNGWTIGRGALQALLAVPWTIPSLVAGLLFVLIFDPHTGVLNYVLSQVGLPQVGWLTNDNVAFWSVSVETVWALYPFVMLVSLAALRAVPSDLYDAAAVDGAQGWALLRWVTLPSISPTLRIVSLFLVIFAFQQFQAIWVMTEGGPIHGTNFLVINVYKTAFVNDDLGQASTVGVIGFVLSAIVTISYFIQQRRWQTER
jgi:multiple sugar transport system permease protein